MKKLTAIVLICIIMIVGCGNSDSTGNKALDGELDLESNQSLVIAQVNAIYGNEITLALAERVDNSSGNTKKIDESSQKTSDSDTTTNISDTSTNTSDTTSNQDSTTMESETTNIQDKTATKSKTTRMQDSTTTKGETINNQDKTATKSNKTRTKDSTEKDSTEKDSTAEDSDANDTSNEDSISVDSSSSGKTDKKAQTQVTRYTLTGEEMTATIPVGTPVTTLLGTVTTFSRIAVDNTLQIVTETNKDGEDVIVAIYIVG